MYQAWQLIFNVFSTFISCFQHSNNIVSTLEWKFISRIYSCKRKNETQADSSLAIMPFVTSYAFCKHWCLYWIDSYQRENKVEAVNDVFILNFYRESKLMTRWITHCYLLYKRNVYKNTKALSTWKAYFQMKPLIIHHISLLAYFRKFCKKFS